MTRATFAALLAQGAPLAACAVVLLFLRGRLTFYNPDGSRPDNSGGAPSCLVAYGRDNVAALAASGLGGKLVLLSPNPREEF